MLLASKQRHAEHRVKIISGVSNLRPNELSPLLVPYF